MSCRNGVCALSTKQFAMSIKLIIMDVDGTIYDQPRLRRKMLFELLGHYLVRPWKWRDVLSIVHFRREREFGVQKQAESIDAAQYEWAAEKSGHPPERIRTLVEEWMYQRPLKHILSCKRLGLDEFVDQLKLKGIQLAFLSDHPPAAKLEVLSLGEFQSFSATHPEINTLKPSPNGLLYIARSLGVPPDACLVIGDRDDRDGEAARRANMKYMILSSEADGNTRIACFDDVWRLLALPHESITS
jgi:phosphoglycolate phosphatase/putative hydrolase of the HAD superfamily